MNNAHWIKNTHLFEKDDYECSAYECKVARPADRCPDCGAEMTGRPRGGHDWTEDAAFLDVITRKM
jgi:hypothetical protein